MKHTKRKITKIVDEMITYCYSIGATKIELLLEDDDIAHYITLKSDFDINELDAVNSLNEKLNQGRSEELEEMYWNLTGMSDLDDEVELQLVSALIDRAEIYIDANICTIYLIRKRAKSR